MPGSDPALRPKRGPPRRYNWRTSRRDVEATTKTPEVVGLKIFALVFGRHGDGTDVLSIIFTALLIPYFLPLGTFATTRFDVTQSRKEWYGFLGYQPRYQRANVGIVVAFIERSGTQKVGVATGYVGQLVDRF
jgi:hypothetical protein